MKNAPKMVRISVVPPVRKERGPRSARKNRNQTPLSGLVQVNTETDMRCTTEIIHREKFEIANYRATRHGQ